MTMIGLTLAAVAALIHVYIFVLESLRFDQPSTWRVFGVPGAPEAALMKPWAFNQGFYNLFLAAGAALGVLLRASTDEGSSAHAAGGALTVYCCAFMVAAAAVLIASDRRKLRAALVQGAAPLLAVVFLLLD